MTQDYQYSNCKISAPILHPGKATVNINGFAWGPHGMMHEISDGNKQSWQTWLATQQ